MKKLLMSLIFILLLIPMTVFAEEKVEIKSITLLEKSENAEINTEAITDGEKINLDLTFYDKGDYATYKVVVYNPTNTGLYINDHIFNKDNKYVLYDFSYEDNSNFVKAGEEKTFNIKVNYKNEVPKELFNSAKYDASTNEPLIFSNTLIRVANTLKNIGILGICVFIVVIACIITGVFVIIKNNKNSGINALLIILLLLLIPNTVSALLKIEVPIDSKVLIKRVKPNPCIYDGELVDNGKYYNGQYTYTYSGANDGWAMSLTDRNSTDPVTTKMCTSVNGKPIYSLYGAFATSKTTSIDLSSFDTSNVVDMSVMFINVSGVTELDASTFDTSKVTNFNAMFNNCSNLGKLDLSSFDFSSATDTNSMFYNDEKLFEIVTPNVYAVNKIDLPLIYTDDSEYYLSLDNNTPKKTRIVYTDTVSLLLEGYDLSNKLKSLAGGSNNIIRIEQATDRPGDYVTSNSNNVISYYTSKIKTYAWFDNGTIYYYSPADTILFNPKSTSIFYGMNYLTYVDFKGLNSSLVTDFRYVFQGSCKNVTSLELDGFEDLNVSRVTSLERLFQSFGTEIENFELDLSGWDVSNVTNVSSLFEDALTNSKTVKIDIHGWDLSNVESTEYTFAFIARNSDKLELNLKDIDFSNLVNCDKFLAYAAQLNPENTTKVDLSGWKFTKVKRLSDFFYYTCCYSKAIDIIGLQNWNVSTVENFYEFFYGVGESIEEFELDLSNWDVSSATSLYRMFKGFGRTASKATLTLKNWKINSAVDVTGLFIYVGYYAKDATIDLSGWDISGRTSVDDIFWSTMINATDNVKLNLSNWKTSSLTSMHNLFSAVGQYAKNVEINLTGWDTSNVTDMSKAFRYIGHGSESVNIIGLADLDTSNVTDMSEMFFNVDHINLDGFKVHGNTLSNMFNGTNYVNGTITITSNPTTYSSMFYICNEADGYELKVDYKESVTNIDNMIATKGDNSHIIKGDVVN